MGIRSDVFVGIKQELLATFPEKFDNMLRDDYGADVSDLSEGRAYSMMEVKWYREEYPELVEFYEWLENVASDQYIVVEACHDYPESTDGDAGDWTNNPWGAYRYVRTGISFDESVFSK